MCAAGRFIFRLGADGDTNALGYQAAMAQACARAWRSAACGLHPSPGRVCWRTMPGELATASYYGRD
jgi:hypothetical protein